MLLSIVSAQAVPTTPTLKIGDYIQMGRYNEKPMLWRCVDLDANGSLILSDKAIGHKAFDAAGEHKYVDGTKQADTRTEDRMYYGSNLWETSSLRSWLNSSAPKEKVVWPDGCPPDSEHADSSLPYADEKGFLAAGNFTASDLSVLKSVSQKTIINELDVPKLKSGGTELHILAFATLPTVLENYDSAFYQNVTDKMFVLDIKQLSKVSMNGNILGNEYYIGTTTIGMDNDTPGFEYYDQSVREGNWLRDSCAYSDEVTGVRIVEPDGVVSWARKANRGGNGVRPAFYMNLSTTVSLSGSGTTTNPYVVTGNAPVITPAAPVTDMLSLE